MINNVVDNIRLSTEPAENILLKEASSEYNKSKGGNETDTTYSSSNLSDSKKQEKSNRNPNKKKNKNNNNNFFLYTVNPIHAKKPSDTKEKEINLTIQTLNSPTSSNDINNPINSNFNSPTSKTPNVSTTTPSKDSNTLKFSQFVDQKNLKNIKSKNILNKERFSPEKIKENKEIIAANASPITNTIPTPANNEQVNFNISLESESKDDKTTIENKNVNITINSPVYNNIYIINNGPLSKNPLSMMNNRNIPNYYPNHQQENEFYNPNYSQNYMFPHYQQPTYGRTLHNPLPFNQYGMHFDESYLNFRNNNTLHNDLFNYSRGVTENIGSLKEAKILIIKKLEKIIKDNLDEFDTSLNTYGSFETELAIESSDIDITLNFKNKQTSINNYSENYNYGNKTDFLINKLVKCFNNLKIFDYVNPIYTASVPVIKLQIDLKNLTDDIDIKNFLTNFKNSPNYINYKFNKDELEKVKIDLTFMINSEDNIVPTSPTLLAVEYVKKFIIMFS